jgi:hypothetical protein
MRLIACSRVARTLLAFGMAAAASAATLAGHHSIAGVYDTGRQITIEGVVAEFQFVNPHPFVIVSVAAADEHQQWTAEMDNRRELLEIGVTEKTLRPGDRVVITGSPSRRQRYLLYTRRLDRPADGFNYEQVGSRPSVGKTPGTRN